MNWYVSDTQDFKLFYCHDFYVRGIDMKKFLLIGLLSASFSANAAPVYVGNFNVFDGPIWTSNPIVYSATEAAALLFGGVASDYYISVNSDTVDSSTITHTAWLDGWGDTTYLFTPTSETYSLSSSGGNYSPSPSFSAYVCDHANCREYGFSEASGYEGSNYTNYVWRVAAVPEPESYAMMLAGLGLIGFMTRRRKEDQV